MRAAASLFVLGFTLALAYAGVRAVQRREAQGVDVLGHPLDYGTEALDALGFGGLLYPTSQGGAADSAAPTGGTLFDGFLNVSYSVTSALGGGGMRTSTAGVDKLREFEGYSATVYPDIAGNPTIGYGHMLRAWESFGTITQEDAVRLLVGDIATAENAVNSLVKVRISQAQFDALVSLAYNIGTGAFKTSTALRRLNAGDPYGAAEAMQWWNKVRQGGRLVVSAGLANRRAIEAQLFTEGIA